jgi:NADH-quinone oxidoreductase subunit J
MEIAFLILASLTLISGFAAMRLPNLVHCALCLVGCFAGLAGLYLLLGAEFVGFAQILVYVGAVAILIVFAVLLTRNSEREARVTAPNSSWIVGIAVAAMVGGTIMLVVLNSVGLQRTLPRKPPAPVADIGRQLMTEYVLPFEVIALLLTAAMIGAVIIAMKDKSPDESRAEAPESEKGHS